MSLKLAFFILLFAPAIYGQIVFNASTSTAIVGYPGSIPCPASSCSSGGSLTGANYTITPTDFNLPITRVTDNSTYSGSAFSYTWSYSDDTANLPLDISDSRFVLVNQGNGMIPFSWNGSALTATKLYGSSYQITSPLPNSDMVWSYTQPYIAYAMAINGSNNPAIYSWDFTSTSTAPTTGNGGVNQLVDLSTCVGAVAGLGYEWAGVLTLSYDDQTFSINLSTTSGQGSSGNLYVILWNRSNGCRVWNTGTGAITGAWGATGTISLPDTFTLHDSELAPSGNYALVSYTTCLTSCSPTTWKQYFWNVPTTTVTYAANSSGADCGHYAAGYTHFVNNCDISSSYNASTYLRIPYNDVNNGSNPPLYVLNPQATPDVSNQDDHSGWQADNSSDTNPVCSTRTSPSTTPTTAYQNEIVCIQANVYGSASIWRFAHNYSSVAAGEPFAAYNAIGAVSKDGKWFLWSTDWFGMLGKNDGSTNACTTSPYNCRTDVFIMALPAIAGYQQASGGTTFSGGIKIQ